MLKATTARNRNGLKYGKFAFTVLIALAFCVVHPASTAYAKKKKPTNGTIKILTAPGGFPLEIDGKPSGETATDYREFELAPGLHAIVISLPNGQRWSQEVAVIAGRRKCVALNYQPVSTHPAKSPCPYAVMVFAPASVSEGDVITFTADVTYSSTSNLDYTWTVSPSDAKIIGGAGSPTITVDSTGFAGRLVTAVLVTNDGSCETSGRQSAQASTLVLPTPLRENPAREFDVCCTCSYDDQKARLDNLAIELQNDPSLTTYVIAYAGRTSRAGQADVLLARAKEYMIKQRGVDQSRIVAVNGGFRDEDCVELWIVPRGAQPPQATPTVNPGDVRPAADKAPRKKGTPRLG
jgi:hypothetical protein